jgi:hypothetical protein
MVILSTLLNGRHHETSEHPILLTLRLQLRLEHGSPHQTDREVQLGFVKRVLAALLNRDGSRWQVRTETEGKMKDEGGRMKT